MFMIKIVEFKLVPREIFHRKIFGTFRDVSDTLYVKQKRY